MHTVFGMIQNRPNSATRSAATPVPEVWRPAYERDRQNPDLGNDPLPERRASRLLAAFIVTGLAFVAFPGTLLGVWNLLAIAGRTGAPVSTAWIQAHGQAQLLGWVGTFILGISLYVLPKFLNRRIHQLQLGWLAWALWTAGVAWRWLVGVGLPHWRTGLAASALLQLAAFFLIQYLLWFERDRSDAGKGQENARKPFPGDLASWLGVAGFTAFGIALLLECGISLHLALHASEPVFPANLDRIFLVITLWGFAIPVAWGYSTRFVTIFAGLRPPLQAAAPWIAAGVGAIVLCAVLSQFLLADLLAAILAITAVWVLRVFRGSVRAPKRNGVYRHYPNFIRVAYAWLLAGAILGVWADLRPTITGLGGASRHALTVGFLAMMIFCVGPLILPSFLASRQLRSPLLMGVSLWLLAAGCFLRVSSEAIAYSSTNSLSWKVLPVSGVIELTAVCIFVLNLGWTMAQPVPAWFAASGINPQMTVYFCVASFPKTKPLLIEAGLKTIARVREIPRSLTLAEAAVADHADLHAILTALRTFFANRQPRRRSLK